MNKTINPPVEQSTDLETSLSAPATSVAQGSGPGEENKTCPPAQPPGPETQNPGSLSYEGLSLPEDISFPTENLAAFKQLAREMNLAEEQVQRLLDFESAHLRANFQQAQEQKRHTVERWAEETRALYGAGLEKELSYALRAADAFGGPELRTLLEDTGLGNHPVIIRTLSEIGKAISEDACPGGKPAAPQDKTFTEALYGKN